MLRQILVLVLISLLLLISCSNRRLKGNLPPEERLAIAKEMFNKRSYLDAQTQFRIIILSHTGSSIVDEAQYYFAECHYQLKEYLLAASEFERLIRVFPNSPWVDDAQFKVGMCYAQLSPRFSLDQANTYKAIENFQRFLEDYRDSELAPQVQLKLNESRHKLAQKEFAAGDQYRRLGNCSAAIIYFDSVLETYYDTEFAPKALYQKGICNLKLGELEAAVAALTTFLEKYPHNQLVERVQQKLREAKEKLAESKQSNKSASLK